MTRTSAWLCLLLVVAAGAILVQRGVRSEAARPARARHPARVATQAAPRVPETSSRPLPAAARDGAPLRYLAVGGGAFPESNEVSLEQNLELAQRVLLGPGRLAFAGGTGSDGVRLSTDDGAESPLLVRLGDLFAPRPGRHSHYRPTRLAAAPADIASVERELQAALSVGSEPLLLYVTTHGEQGEHARANSVTLWGGESLNAERLAQLHDQHPRPLVAVIASCFSGGFAELAFEAGDQAAGPARAPRCGLFAGTWDRETSGCDPDPERARQQGYSLHVLHALLGRDRDGRVLAVADLDHDGDGRVSLLEAHAWASMSSRSFDVPTTTSERYLRAVQRVRGRSARAQLPEHARVVDRLSALLGLVGEPAAAARFEQLEQQLNQLDDRLKRADEDSDEAYRALAGRLLARWPVLDDAYHADLAPLLAREEAAIVDALDTWPEAARFGQAEAEVERLERQREPIEVDAAVVLRLLRAHETLALAGGLSARGGKPLEHFRRLLACERFSPPITAAEGVPRGGRGDAAPRAR